jgi:hypothetical protein
VYKCNDRGGAGAQGVAVARKTTGVVALRQTKGAAAALSTSSFGYAYINFNPCVLNWFDVKFNLYSRPYHSNTYELR